MLSLTEQPREMSLTLSVESPCNTSNNPRNQVVGRKILAPIESKEGNFIAERLFIAQCSVRFVGG